MKIPEKIKIGCYTYKVNVVDNPLLIEGNTVGYGNINFDTHTITISKRPNPLKPEVDHQTVEQVFMHEVFHGIINLCALNIEDEDITEEIVVDELAKAMLGIIKDNPGIFNHSPDEA